MTKLSFEQLTDIFLLLSIEGIGPGKIRSLLSKFKSTKNILSADYNSLLSAEGISTNLAKRIYSSRKRRYEINDLVDKELSKLKKLNARIVSIWDRDYPSLLKKIYDPPLLLEAKGNFVERDEYSIGVVGTRMPTNYGRIQTEKVVSEFARQQITTVSGLARGIDSIAHSTSIRNNGRTIAVIGSGLDVIYPPENKKLFDQISENGIVISEYLLGTQPDAQNFPKRNRLISGLSLGVVVIETGATGGATQTARFALDQNREVFALPGNVGVKQSDGTNELIHKGEATLIRNAEDVLLSLELKLKPVLGKNIPKKQVGLNLFEEKIINVLDNEPMQIDKIATATNLSTSDCLVHLLSLEFKGMIKQLPGKVFAIL